MSNKFQSVDNLKFKQTLTGASGHFEALLLHDNLGWQDTEPRLITGHKDNIYHYGKRLLKEGDVIPTSETATTSLISATASGIKINEYQANLFGTGDLVRYDYTTNFYIKSIASDKETADVVGVVDYVSGTHDFLKDSSPDNRSLHEYYVNLNATEQQDISLDPDATPTLPDTSVYMYGTTSAAFNRDGFLRAPFSGPNDNFYLGTGDFTLEFWFNTSSSLADVKDKDGAAQNQIILTDYSKGDYAQKTKGVGGFEIELSRDRSVKAKLSFQAGAMPGLYHKSLATPSSYYYWNTWNHVALQRSGTNLSLWFNGSTGGGGQRALWGEIGAEDKLYDSRPVSSGITIGKAAENWQKDSYSGHLEELRYSSSARHAGTFNNDLPRKRFDSDNQTRLLMHFDSGRSFFRYVGHGIVDSLTGLKPGNVYFLSPTVSGLYDQNESYGIGEISKPVFTALSEDTAYVHNYRGIEVTEITDTYYANMTSPPNEKHSPGQRGSVAYDEHYWYVCIKPDYWKRTAIGEW